MTTLITNKSLTLSALVENPTLRAYLRSVRNWHGYIRFLGLPDRRDNPDVLIDRLFVEPFLINHHVSPDEDPSRWSAEAETIFDVLKNGRRVVLLGDPGTGKSTLLNYLVWLLARPTGEIWSARMDEWLLPVPMVLRELQLRDVTSFRGLMDAFLNHAMSEPLRGSNLLTQMLTDGRALILLDGIDEIGDSKARENLRTAVFDGFELYPNCFWLLSSRVVGYHEVRFDYRQESKLQKRELSDEYSESPKGYLKLTRKIRVPSKSSLTNDFFQFEKNGSSELITRYIAPFDNRQIETFVRNWYFQREPAQIRAVDATAHLVNAVHADDAILRLARIPNLLTMMALIHRIEATLPHGRSLLYERISEAYLESIDKFRGVYSGAYNLQQKRRWLARVGYEMQRRRSADQEQGTGSGESELLVEKGKVISWLNEEMSAFSSSEALSPEEFLDYVGRRSGLFLPRSDGYYAFVHLSFQEFFAAVALEREVTGPKWLMNQKTSLGLSRKILVQWATKSVWRETFLFLFELLTPKRDWHEQIYHAIFDMNSKKLKLSENDATENNLTQLLTYLAINPRSGLLEEKKWNAINTVVSSVLEYQNRKPVNWSRVFNLEPDVHFKELFGDDSDWNSKILKLICEQVSKLQASNSDIQVLSVEKTQVSDIGPLSRLTSLKYLNLNDTQVSDIGPLSRLTSLEFLHLNDTQVSDIGPLSHLTSLTFFNLNGTQISDIGPLSRLTSLEILELSSTQVSDIGPLSRLTSLEILELSSTQVSDIGSLSRLTSLEILDLNNTQVSDIGSLSRLTSLEILGLGNTQISDIGPLSHLTSLIFLSLNDTQVSDIGPLSRLTSLENLYLSNTQVSDIGPLSRLTSLRVLSLENTQVSDIGPLSRLTSLETIHLSSTQVSDISPLSHLTSLRVLSLENTQVSDIGPLSHLTSLRVLDLDYTQVSDIGPLSRFTSLERVYLNGTQVSDLESLFKLSALKYIHLNNTPVSEHEISRIRNTLPTVLVFL